MTEEEKEKQEKEQKEEKTAKRWKGKDWFSILAPKFFGEDTIAEVPATDQKSLIGRNIEINLSDITKNPKDYPLKLRFQIKKVENKKCYTEFNGLSVVREHVSRFVRKNTKKVELVSKLETNDKWKLRAKCVIILNRHTYTEIERKMRTEIEKFLKASAQDSTMEEFIKAVCSNSLQKNIKKMGNKIYPIRFSEIAKVEILEKPNL